MTAPETPRLEELEHWLKMQVKETSKWFAEAYAQRHRADAAEQKVEKCHQRVVSLDAQLVDTQIAYIDLQKQSCEARDKLLAIAGHVNGYHNNGPQPDALVAFRTLRAIADVLGKPMEAPPVTSLWQPIETAPKDGSSLLLSDGKTVCEGGWIDAARQGAEPDEAYLIQEDWWSVSLSGPPTHWMPLPEYRPTCAMPLPADSKG